MVRPIQGFRTLTLGDLVTNRVELTCLTWSSGIEVSQFGLSHTLEPHKTLKIVKNLQKKHKTRKSRPMNLSYMFFNYLG